MFHVKYAANRITYCPYWDTCESERETLLIIILGKTRVNQGFYADVQLGIDMNYETRSSTRQQIKIFLKPQQF